MNKKSNVDELLEAAKISHNRSVKQALDKLLFTVSIAHDKEYIERANDYYFHSGCTITIPQVAENVTMQLVWNDEEIAVRSTEHCFAQFKYGSMIEENDPVPGIILQEERNCQ